MIKTLLHYIELYRPWVNAILGCEHPDDKSFSQLMESLK